MRVALKIAISALAVGGLLTVLIVFFFGDPGGPDSMSNGTIFSIWGICSLVVGAVLALVEASFVRARARTSRLVALSRHVRDLAEDHSKANAWSTDPRICFIGIREMSDSEPFYSFAASQPYRLSELAQRAENGFLDFHAFPAPHLNRFAYSGSRPMWVPEEISRDTVSALNAAVTAPFPKKKLLKALDVLSAVPWDVDTGRRGSPGMWATPDPYRGIT